MQGLESGMEVVSHRQRALGETAGPALAHLGMLNSPLNSVPAILNAKTSPESWE